MIYKPEEFMHVDYLWNDEEVNNLDAVENLIYRSNILGSDLRITNTGGGNTSAKIMDKDPLTGTEVEVLWVKGSGGDLRTSVKENFATLYQEKLNSLNNVYQSFEDKGYKEKGEDRMVGMFPHCVFNLNPRASSIDTPLHFMIDEKHVDHMHSNAVIAVATCKDQVALTETIWGGKLAYMPWIRPGWEAALLLKKTYEANPGIDGVLMGQHGHINWANESKACYDLSLSIAERAARFIEEHDKGEFVRRRKISVSLRTGTCRFTL